jgi:acetyl esterase
MKFVTPLVLGLLFHTLPVHAEQAVSVRQEIYKRVGDLQLTAQVYELEKDRARKRPAIVFFFGGGWRNGSVNQFRYHSEYLARHGMVAIVPDYRVSSRHMAEVVDCVSDARSAIRWVRANARRLGIDPDRIAAGGGSAGGHLAAATALLPELKAEGENARFRSQPNVLVLFNPALDLRREAFPDSFTDARYEEIQGRLGDTVEQLSPRLHLRSNLPATIIFHGQADRTIPYQTVKNYSEAARAHGNRCELVGYDDADHGFFNFGRAGNGAFIDTMQRSHRFLADLGYLDGKPDVVEFIQGLGTKQPK